MDLWKGSSCTFFGFFALKRWDDGEKKGRGKQGGRSEGREGEDRGRRGREDDTLVVTVRCHVISSSVFLAVSVSLVLHADPENSIVHKIIILLFVIARLCFFHAKLN